MTWWLVVLVAGAGFIGGAHLAFAQGPDFTITVPVRLTAMRTDVVGGVVTCTLFEERGGGMPGGSQSQQFPIDPNVGSVSRDLVFNLRTTVHPSRITYYRCELGLYQDIDGRSRRLVPAREGGAVFVEGPVPR